MEPTKGDEDSAPIKTTDGHLAETQRVTTALVYLNDLGKGAG